MRYKEIQNFIFLLLAMFFLKIFHCAMLLRAIIRKQCKNMRHVFVIINSYNFIQNIE